jgi:anaerobic ribonucleoside-triphosphate reductase activating protein
MDVRINKIIPRSFVDGPGQRAVVFFQGCSLHCPGCQNRSLWPADGGRSVDAGDLAQTLALLSGVGRAVTITGGEPFQQPAALLALVSELRNSEITNIIVYTGYRWDELRDPSNPAFSLIEAILTQIDVLVDGRFVRALDDDLIAWRGSRNQRPIDVPASIPLTGPVVLDWDQPEIMVDANGVAYLPFGLAAVFSSLGRPLASRMCGQTAGEPECTCNPASSTFCPVCADDLAIDLVPPFPY